MGIGSWGVGMGLPPPPPPLCDFHDHIVDPPSEDDFFAKNINVYELYTVLASLRRWGSLWGGTQIQIVTDNNQVMYMVNTGWTANKCCMSWLREIFWLCFIFNVELFAVYIPSRDNVFADALSRADNSRMLDLVLDAICELNLCCCDITQVKRRQRMSWQQERVSY